MTAPYRGLNAALARSGGPSAEDVDLAAWLRDWRLADCEHAEVRDGGIICCSPCLWDRILASDWLAAHTSAAEARGAERGARAVVEAVEAEGHKHLGSNPFSVKVAMLDAARETAARVGSPEVCSTCGGAFDSPPCSLNREIGWSGHTRSGGAATGTRVEGGA